MAAARTRSVRLLCPEAAALSDLRASRPAACGPADVHRLGEPLYALHRYHRLHQPDPQYFGDATLSGAAARSGPRKWWHGLIAELVRVEKEAGQISRDELVAMVFLLLFAGHETTTHLISGSVYKLLRNPALRDWLKEDWSRAGLAVEEFLWFISVVQFTKPRFIRKDVELGSVRLKKGEKIMPMLAAANFDPQANPHREQLDLGESRTGISPSAPEFIFASVISAHRGSMRPKGLVPALAETAAGGGRVPDQMAQAAGPQGYLALAGRDPALRRVGRGLFEDSQILPDGPSRGSGSVQAAGGVRPLDRCRRWGRRRRAGSFQWAPMFALP